MSGTARPQTCPALIVLYPILLSTHFTGWVSFHKVVLKCLKLFWIGRVQRFRGLKSLWQWSMNTCRKFTSYNLNYSFYDIWAANDSIPLITFFKYIDFGDFRRSAGRWVGAPQRYKCGSSTEIHVWAAMGMRKKHTDVWTAFDSLSLCNVTLTPEICFALH